MMSLWKDRGGSVAIYTAVVGTMMIAMSALAVDYGRLTVLRTQMQNAADAAALAGAAQLDGRTDAMARAVDVARNAAQQTSGLADTLTVANATVYRSINPDITVGITDANARFIRVTMANENINLLFMPVLNALTAAGSAETATLQATATAQANPFLCPPTTIMACDRFLAGVPLIMSSPTTAGYQLALRDRNAVPAQLVYFMRLCPSDNPTCSAAEATAFAADASSDQCDSSTVRPLAPGTDNATAIADGINTRFGEGASPEPAENVVFYDRDSVFDGLTVASPFLESGWYGAGDWESGTYWSDHHGGASLPAALAGASRYQVHLYELGQDFARNSKQTIFPLPASLPAGFTAVISPPADIPVGADPSDEWQDGVPDAGVASTDPKRRVMIASVVDCEAQVFAAPISPTGGYVELFLTERSEDSVIFVEVIGEITLQNSDDFHVNVQLVQ